MSNSLAMFGRLKSEITALLRRKFVQDTIALQISKMGVTALGLVAWVIVPVRLGPAGYGLFALAQSLLGIWSTLNLTGLNTSTVILLSTAVGAKDQDEILNIMAMYTKVMFVWGVFSIISLLLIATPLAEILYREPVTPAAVHGESYTLMAGLETVGNPRIGVLAAFLAFFWLFDPSYNLILTAFRSRRAMRTVGILQNMNQFVLTVSLVAAALISPTPEGQVVARIIYSIVTLLIALVIYNRLKLRDAVPYPPFMAIIRRAVTVSYRPYWRFGLENALDKNISGLYTQLPLQLVGIIAGPVAASYIQLGQRGINRAEVLTSAIFDNMQTVIPQAVGREDYVRLNVNFIRALVVLTLGGLLFYGAFVLLAPLVIVPIFGEEWIPILPLLPVFAIYGIVTTVGGVFGPLYRAFDLMSPILKIKIITLAVMAPVGVWMILQADALGGVWMINGMFMMSVALTAWVTLPALKRRAAEADTAHE
jgi:O-antigen/teichoic acid export membrane protein